MNADILFPEAVEGCRADQRHPMPPASCRPSVGCASQSLGVPTDGSIHRHAAFAHHSLPSACDMPPCSILPIFHQCRPSAMQSSEVVSRTLPPCPRLYECVFNGGLKEAGGALFLVHRADQAICALRNLSSKTPAPPVWPFCPAGISPSCPCIPPIDICRAAFQVFI